MLERLILTLDFTNFVTYLLDSVVYLAAAFTLFLLENMHQFVITKDWISNINIFVSLLIKKVSLFIHYLITIPLFMTSLNLLFEEKIQKEVVISITF